MRIVKSDQIGIWEHTMCSCLTFSTTYKVSCILVLQKNTSKLESNKWYCSDIINWVKVLKVWLYLENNHAQNKIYCKLHVSKNAEMMSAHSNIISIYEIPCECVCIQESAKREFWSSICQSTADVLINTLLIVNTWASLSHPLPVWQFSFSSFLSPVVQVTGLRAVTVWQLRSFQKLNFLFQSKSNYRIVPPLKL